MSEDHAAIPHAPLVRSAWAARRRRRRRTAMVVTSILVLVAGLLVLSRFASIGYRRDYRMLELRDGMVGYYSNPVYKGFAWLDRGREQGLMVTGGAKVPPGPYRLYARNQYWVAVYVKLWHVAALVAVPAAWTWWRVGRNPRPGRCFNCGYDLTGRPSGQAGPVSCPECGAVDDERRDERASNSYSEQEPVRDSRTTVGDGSRAND